jgi:hypothetical protein
MPRLLKIAGRVSLALAGLLLLGGGLFAVNVLLREPVRTVPSTRHASLSRAACLECHAPIADEWRQSYHFKSLSGPYWKDVRRLGYLDLFNRVRKQCVNCHAPANVLDLAPTRVRGDLPLGVECTPNLLREPSGIVPAARADEPELGVDCTSCHVGRRGVVGSGRLPTAEHATFEDARFQDSAVASDSLCGTCHGSTVEAWKRTSFRSAGITCLDCHMPGLEAPAVAGGPPRQRRSHRFAADKDATMLARAVNGTLEVTPMSRRVRFRIVNDRVGHYFPSGGNWLSLRLEARDDTGRVRAERVGLFGREEALLLDFWPFNIDDRIPSGERREIVLSLPKGHGTVRAVVNYHDWMKTRRSIATLEGSY